MLIVPAELTNSFRLPAVSPKFQLVLFHRVNSELSLVAALNPLRPGIAQQAIGENSKLVRFFRGDRDLRKLRAESFLLQNHFVLAGRQVDLNGAAGSGACFER